MVLHRKSMKITLPENKSEINLSQYQRYDKLIKKGLSELDTAIEKVCIFTNLKRLEAESLTYKDLVDICNQIDIALNEEADFKHRFFINDVEFGFAVLDKMQGKEHIDAVNYLNQIEDPQSYHKLMAVLFRPIVKKGVGNTFKIANYQGTSEWGEIMKNTPLNIVDGALGFFLHLRNELQNYILKYTTEAQARERQAQTTLVSTDG